MFVDKRRKSRRILSDSEVNVAPEASDLLFESEDVAELLAEVTGQVVDVTADSNEVVFSVGEGDEAETFPQFLHLVNRPEQFLHLQADLLGSLTELQDLFARFHRLKDNLYTRIMWMRDEPLE